MIIFSVLRLSFAMCSALTRLASSQLELAMSSAKTPVAVVLNMIQQSFGALFCVFLPFVLPLSFLDDVGEENQHFMAREHFWNSSCFSSIVDVTESSAQMAERKEKRI
ncbi:hypothetical protein AVEN_59749-1 [Araneus ventricosus]|uniref:Uncharacterized protein n=1 Tax=Araneus ventricosus TaxID=182803 RepID=A0A4Y2BMV3_ARAVE|nr:hypothetical protein AVEN_59749-1 [Araneus ventricosus]